MHYMPPENVLEACIELACYGITMAVALLSFLLTGRA
jgi:hypothetical protein